MSNYERVMVALDLSSTDKQLLKYSEFFTRILESRAICFVHIMPDMTKPKNIAVEFHKLFSPDSPIDEKVRDKISEEVMEVFDSEGEKSFSFEVVEGKPYEKLIHWTEVKAVNVLVVGRKKQSEGSGITARRVARKTKSDVLFVPENIPEKIENIVVPVDFSVHSYRALRKALDIRRALPDVKIIALNIISRAPFDIYSLAGQNREVAEALTEKAKSDFDDFLEEYELPKSAFQPVFKESMVAGVTKGIRQYLAEEPTNLVIIGAKGHSPYQTFLYGSVTEAFVEIYYESPVLVVR